MRRSRVWFPQQRKSPECRSVSGLQHHLIKNYGRKWGKPKISKSSLFSFKTNTKNVTRSKKSFIDSDEYENNYILNPRILRRIYMNIALACTNVVKSCLLWTDQEIMANSMMLMFANYSLQYIFKPQTTINNNHYNNKATRHVDIQRNL